MKLKIRFQKTLAVIVLSLLGIANVQAAVSINYVVNNHLGAPVLLVNENQHVVWEAEYDEFGKATILVEEVEFNVRFPGQYYDKETGLTYNYYRDYDPSLGRYVQSDPIGLAGGINTYGYVGGNPVSYIDPLGLYSAPYAAIALANFTGNHSEDWSTSFNSINWGNAETKIYIKIKELVPKSCSDTQIKVDFVMESQTEGADAFIIGRHNLRVKGVVDVKGDSWTFSGNMSSASGVDLYNMNKSNREPVGEALTTAGRKLDGTPFNIYITGSKQLSFSGKVSK